MNTLALTLALIFLPGIIWARLDARYGSQTKPSQFDLIVNVFVFGLIAYVGTYLIYLIPWIGSVAAFDLAALEVDDEEASDVLSAAIVDDIIVATALSLLLAPAWLAIKNYKLITRFLQLIRVTNRYGDEDVWDFTLNAADKQTRYVNLRDTQTGLTFTGYVEVYSENPALRELVLRDVVAYDSNSGEERYTLPRLYLAREPKGMTLEFPVDSTYVWIDADPKERSNG